LNGPSVIPSTLCTRAPRRSFLRSFPGFRGSNRAPHKHYDDDRPHPDGHEANEERHNGASSELINGASVRALSTASVATPPSMAATHTVERNAPLVIQGPIPLCARHPALRAPLFTRAAQKGRSPNFACIEFLELRPYAFFRSVRFLGSQPSSGALLTNSAPARGAPRVWVAPSSSATAITPSKVRTSFTVSSRPGTSPRSPR
jgi:hypothetical protein